MARFELAASSGRGTAELCRFALAVFAGKGEWEDTRLHTDEARATALDGLTGPKQLPVLFHDASQTEVSGAREILQFVGEICTACLPAAAPLKVRVAETTALSLSIRIAQLCASAASMEASARASCLDPTPAIDDALAQDGTSITTMSAAPIADPESPGLAACLDGLEAIAAGASGLLKPRRAAPLAPARAAAAASSAAEAGATAEASALPAFLVCDAAVVAALDAATTLSGESLDARPHLLALYRWALADVEPLASYVAGRGALEAEGPAESAPGGGPSRLAAVPPPAGAGPPPPGPLVCVTGATGFIAGHLIRLLLERGMRVRGTVRPGVGGGVRTAHLRAMPGAKARLELFEADLLVEGSFAEAVAGCECVHHCASPFFTAGVADEADAEEKLLRPAVEGTLNVLRAAAEGGARRVVVTGSTASLYVDGGPKDTWYDEDCWSDEALLRAERQWYPLSKLLAEQAAWRFVGEAAAAGDPTPELVTLCPTLVVGPVLVPRTTTSTQRIKAFVDGSTEACPNDTKCMVDVRDVAEAHLAAQLRADASGRYCLIGAVIAWREVARVIGGSASILATKAAASGAPTGQAVQLPTAVADGPVPYPQALFSQERAVDGLGLRFTPIERTLRDTVLSFLTFGMLPAAKGSA